MSIKYKKYVLNSLIVAALFILNPSYDLTKGFNVSLIKKAEAYCYMSGSGSYHTLTCYRPRFPGANPSLGYLGSMNASGGVAGSGVWDQGEDWSGDDAKGDYDKAMAEIGYDLRTGNIDAKEACSIAARVDRNHCRAGHSSAAAIVGTACSLVGAVMTSPTAGTVGIAACASAVGVKLNNELDNCDLAHEIRLAMCD